MARVFIDMPEKFNFTTEINVRVSDVNYGSHLGNDSVLSLAHEARTQYFKKLSYKDEIHIEGVGIIIADAALIYKSEAYLHDVLVIDIAISEISKVGFDMLYKISKKFSGIDVAYVKTGVLFYDYEKKKIVSIPPAFLTKIT